MAVVLMMFWPAIWAAALFIIALAKDLERRWSVKGTT